jgi:hypothetical protein
MRAAVVHRPEDRAIVIDLGRQREDLIAARVGQDVPAPVRETMQTAQRLDGVDAGPQHEVIRVAQHHVGTEHFEIARRQMAHGATRADGHETRRDEVAARGVHAAGTRCALSGVEGDRRLHCWCCSSIASPNDKNRYCSRRAMS